MINKVVSAVLIALVVLLSGFAIQQRQQLSAATQNESIDKAYEGGLKSEIESLQQENSHLRESNRLQEHTNPQEIIQGMEPKHAIFVNADYPYIAVEEFKWTPVPNPYSTWTVIDGLVVNSSSQLVTNIVIDWDAIDENGTILKQSSIVISSIPPHGRVKIQDIGPQVHPAKVRVQRVNLQ